MGFSLFFWRKNKSPVMPPTLPVKDATAPPMPFVRDQQPAKAVNESAPSPTSSAEMAKAPMSERLSRIQEMLAKLPPPGQAPAQTNQASQTQPPQQTTPVKPIESAPTPISQVTNQATATPRQTIPAQPPLPPPPISKENIVHLTPSMPKPQLSQAPQVEMISAPEHHLTIPESHETSPQEQISQDLSMRKAMHQGLNQSSDEIFLKGTPQSINSESNVRSIHVADTVLHRTHREHKHQHIPLSDDVLTRLNEEVPPTSPTSSPLTAHSEMLVDRVDVHPSVREFIHEADSYSNPIVHNSLKPNFDTRASNAFYARDGGVYWTIGDLSNSLQFMNPDVFKHHANNERNDFANWIEGCFSGDEKTVGHAITGLDQQGMIRLLNRMKESSTENSYQTSNQHQTPHQTAHPHQFMHRLDEHISYTAQPTHVESTTGAQPIFDDKQPVVMDIKPEFPPSTNNNEKIRQVLDALEVAHLQAATDVGAAREAFITARTRAWSELTDEERRQVLPKLREIYEFLRVAK